MPGIASRSLKERVLRAGGWTLAGYGAVLAIRLGSTLIMTRLLVPEMFGVMAIASMVMTILSMMSDLGLRSNIVQSPRGEDPVFLDTAWVVQIIRGVALWGVASLVGLGLYLGNLSGAFPPSSVYASPVLPLVIIAGTFSAVISGLAPTGIALAQRHFDQKRLVQMELVSQLFGFLFMAAVGMATQSIWALVAGGLVSSTTLTILSHWWLKAHRNRFRWDRSALRELMGFGKWTAVSSVFTVLSLNGDRLLLGGLVEADVLGMYAIATLILGTIEGALGRFFGAVSLPALSEIARTDPARLREIYYRLRVPGDLILLFSAGALYVAGQGVIDLLYDPRYAAAGGMLQVLAFSYFSARYNVAYHVYLAVGKPRYLAAINMVRCVSLLAVIPVSYAFGGTQAVVWGISLHGLAMIPLLIGFNVRLGLNDTRREFAVLAALPVGFACGHAFALLAGTG